MGQYYKPVLIKQGDSGVKILGWMYSWDYENGLKLMEHSYLRNDFVSAFEGLLAPDGQFHKTAVVWAGDYADNEQNTEANLYQLCEYTDKINPTFISENVDSNTQIKDIKFKNKFIVNHTKKLFVDKNKCPVSQIYEDKEGNIYYTAIHPLPLLTCEGNGLGGGDFFYHRKRGMKHVGTWARDIISVENVVPDGYKELKPNFAENLSKYKEK